MTTDQFMLWRFRTTEGVLANIKSWNLTECVFENGSRFLYDNTNEIITIENYNNILSEKKTMRFSELSLDKLKSMGFKERPENERHTCSYTKSNYAFVYPANKK